MATKVIMPQLGESVVEGTVTKWLKQEGETIQEMEGLLDISTDKVETEIPSPAGGVLLKVLVGEGETVKAGTILAWIGEAGEALPGKRPLPQPPPQAVESARPAEEPPAGTTGRRARERAGFILAGGGAAGARATGGPVAGEGQRRGRAHHQERRAGLP